MATPQKKYDRILALRGREMPDNIELDGVKWKKLKAFKHDFFAATGLYENPVGAKLVLKIFRPYSYYGIPYGLLSRWQAAHEEKIYFRMQDSGHVPKWLGRYGKTGIMHEFIPGRDLNYKLPVSDGFFDQLEKILRTMHSMGMAYLDTNKPDNVLLGDDGKCYLIDFQITWVQPPFPLNILTWPLFHIFKNSDLYHLAKHKRKIFPETMSKEEFERMRPWYLRLHRIIFTPIRKLRRNYLRKVESGATKKPEGAAKH
jgi:hypothetical protein